MMKDQGRTIKIGGSALVALAIILAGYYFLLRPDSCTSELYLNGRSLSLETAIGELGVNAKASPAIQQNISERLQAWAQTSSQYCRMHREGVISDAQYRVEIRRIADSYNRIDAALNRGQLQGSNVSAADLDALVFNRIVRPNSNPFNAGPFIIFFDWSSHELTPQATAILDNVIQSCRAISAANGRAVISIGGYADDGEAVSQSSRTTPIDLYVGRASIAARRISSVIRYLRADRGSPCDATITFADFGTSRPLVTTADGLREPQNRRTEISMQPAL